MDEQDKSGNVIEPVVDVYARAQRRIATINPTVALALLAGLAPPEQVARMFDGVEKIHVQSDEDKQRALTAAEEKRARRAAKRLKAIHH